jgi:hypothetical protein
MKTIKLEISKGSQDVIYKEILNLGKHKVQITIRSDAYNFQSSAKISVWKDLEWSLIDSIHHGQMKTRHGLAYDNYVERDFKLDRDTLLKVAKQILE